MQSTTENTAASQQDELAKLREQLAATEAELARAKTDSVQWMVHYAGCAATLEKLRHIITDASRTNGRSAEIAVDEAKVLISSPVDPDSLLRLGDSVVDMLVRWWGEPSATLVDRAHVRQWILDQKSRARAQMTAFTARVPITRN